ncbi:flavin-containing monooxygenase, partial [Bacillus cereus]|uniref:flavin-containing monooxygenase n=1 Tax=Bacillus cereus TaxID=1396 RepID=UPI00366F9427
MSANSADHLAPIDVATGGVALNKESLAAALDSANDAVLLASVVMATGRFDLIDRYTPSIDYPTTPYAPAKLPEPLAGELHDLAVSVFSTEQSPERMTTMQPEEFRRLTDLVVGYSLPDEYMPFLADQAGFDSFRRYVPVTRMPSSDVRVAIIGAGMAGIATAIALSRRGFSYTIFEESGDIGGTWRLNNYPGVAVDTSSVYYSYSYHQNPEWTHHFPVGHQYRDYLHEVVRKWGVLDNVVFNAPVRKMRWDEQASEWAITVGGPDGGWEERFTAVVPAAGYLNSPKFVAAPGRDVFAGTQFHTTHWPESLDLQGKRVAIIGAGATAVQIVNEIIGDVASLAVYQRQPHWVMPNSGDTRIPEGGRWLLANVPYYSEWTRLRTSWMIGDSLYTVVRYDHEWVKSHDVSISPLNDMMMQAALAHIDSVFGLDSELGRK